MKEEIKKFVFMCEATRMGYKGEKIQGLSVQDLKDAGISDATINWLSKNRYIAIHKDKPIWISWSNKYYPTQTIGNLAKTVRAFEKEFDADK